jgi:hypothetical protein
MNKKNISEESLNIGAIGAEVKGGLHIGGIVSIDLYSQENVLSGNKITYITYNLVIV